MLQEFVQRCKTFGVEGCRLGSLEKRKSSGKGDGNCDYAGDCT